MPEYSLEFTKGQLKGLAEEYDKDDYVDISAFNYFEMALEWIEELEVLIAEAAEDNT